jgi:transposase
MPRSKRRNFTADFKAQVVLDLLSGRSSQAELCRKHRLSPSLVTLWKETFHERLAVVFQSDEQARQQQARVAELEQLVGRQALELEILKKASRLLPGSADSNGRSL